MISYAQWLHPKESLKYVDQDDVTAMCRFIRPGDTVLDIGAHTGHVTLPFALAAGPTGLVLAFEPNPYVFKILAKNASLNRDKTNIVPLNVAATDHDDEFTFHYSDGAFCNGGFLDQINSRRHGHRAPLKVQGRNLETLLRREYASRLPRLTWVKIDTEGYDRHVIRSLGGILREYQPVVRCEVYKRLTRIEREAQYDALVEAGYQCFMYVGGERVMGQRLDRKNLEREPHFDIIALPPRLCRTAAAA